MTELDKWAKIHDEARIILQFLEWAGGNHGDDLDIVYKYFEIDGKQLEKERRELLEKIQAEARK